MLQTNAKPHFENGRKIETELGKQETAQRVSFVQETTSFKLAWLI